MIIPLMCDMLIDQNRYIGGDPVGHACCGEAVQAVLFQGRYHLMCESCMAMDQSRLSVLLGFSGCNTPEEAVEMATKRARAAVESVLGRSLPGQ